MASSSTCSSLSSSPSSSSSASISALTTILQATRARFGTSMSCPVLFASRTRLEGFETREEQRVTGSRTALARLGVVPSLKKVRRVIARADDDKVEEADGIARVVIVAIVTPLLCNQGQSSWVRGVAWGQEPQQAGSLFKVMGSENCTRLTKLWPVWSSFARFRASMGHVQRWESTLLRFETIIGGKRCRSSCRLNKQIWTKYQCYNKWPSQLQ